MNRAIATAAAIALVFLVAGCATDGDLRGGRYGGADASRLAWPATDLCSALRTPCINVNVDAQGKITSLTEFNTGADAKELKVFGANNFVIWIINGSTIPFDADGISFKDPPLGNPIPPADEFSCRPYLAGRVFACVDQNKTKNKFYYYIKLANGFTLDPHLVNN